MGGLPSWAPSALPLGIQGEGASVWSSLVLGVALCQIALGVLFNVFSAENP